MDATRILEGAVEFDSSNYRGQMLLSKAYLLQNRINESIKSNLKAAALDPTNAEPLFELGQIYTRDQKTWGKALKSFQKVLEINPRYPKAYYMAGKVALLMGNKGQALQYVESEKKMNPSLADPYILAADISFSDGNYARAVNELRRAVQIRPNDSQLYVEMAKSHRLLGQLDVATAMLRTAMAKESGNPEIYKEQGLVFEKQGDTDAALTGFSKYQELKPNAEDRKEIQQKMSTLGGP
jgi:tetratricopeptide (TPR) repeat protein